MKNKVSLILSISLVVSFMGIRISYNGGESVSMLSATLNISENILKNGLELRWDRFDSNFSSRVIEILLLSIGLILTAFLNKIKFNTVLAVFFTLYAVLLSVLYHSLIDLNLFLLSSIPFYLFSVTLIIKNIVNIGSVLFITFKRGKK